MTARAPNTFIVGAGAVATALAGGLRQAGVPVLGLWARRPEASRAAAAAAGVAGFSPAPPDLLLEAEVVIVAVKDDAIGEVAARLCATGLVGERHVLVHCAGATAAADAFAAVAGKVGGLGTLHPLRAIPTGAELARQRGGWKGTVFGVEGDGRGRAAADALVRSLGGTALSLDAATMAPYHAAAAIASNFAVAVLDAAVATLAAAGLDRDAALAALAPLAQGAIANAASRGLADGLTGPIRRGDAGTVARHLAAVAGDPELAALYRVLGRRTLALARPGLSAEAAAALDALLVG
ncbi:MAG: DUF2520 domain-containing protein [Kofleriaceae bacterium]|jgi:predicted short-subunit dehydrogenase-like oxidoreductase (DUF2520 family)|nr:DUF2520 domain-containing protein [Kofleriaceae bacterium]MBP9172522.1 DUF2520 domain-containing protein [Kofleriaceae bacterium]MBP9861781.1 DUF2520 domain-containing protein [Kofleriaceae bacterium]